MHMLTPVVKNSQIFTISLLRAPAARGIVMVLFCRKCRNGAIKHLFIVNPVAGGKDRHEYVAEQARLALEGSADAYEVYITTAPMDACAKIAAEAASGEELRVYACGGDGTLNECVNGAVGHANVAVTHFPCGTGNDFIKMFGEEKERFFDLAELVRGEVRPFDVMECCGRYAVNICSVGIDARIGTEVHQYHDSYVLSVVANLFKGIAQPLTVRGCGMEYSGGTSLICACNGRFYGGGFNPIPDSRPDNGKLEFLVVRDVSRLTFIRLVGKYAKGRYRELANLITHLEGDHLEIDSETELVVNIDGEALWSKHVNFDLIPGGVNFLVPANMAFFHPETAGGHETREFVHA